MGAQQSQMVNEDDDRYLDQSQFSQDEDDQSVRGDNHENGIPNSSQHDKPVFSSQLPTSARRDRDLGKMNSTKSRKRRTQRSSDADQGLPAASSQDFDPPFVKHEQNGTQDDDDDEDTIMQIKGDPGALDEEPAEVLEDEEFGAEILEKAKRERRERREMKKARKAEKLRLSQHKADPNGMDETDSHDASQLNGVSPEVQRTNGFVAVNHHQAPADEEAVAASKPSKRRKRQAAVDPVAEEAIGYDENGEVSNLALLPSSANDSLLPVSSPLKRKGRSSSDRKSHKKQKQQMDDVEEDDVDATHMSVPFADAAQDIYSQRYNEAQSSPSEARLQRRSQSRADSVEAEQSDDDLAQHVKPEHVPESDDEEIVPQTMDIDEDNDEENEVEEEEEELPANDHETEQEAVAANNDEDHLGSDDLGVAEPMDVDHESSDAGVDGNAEPTPASKDQASGSASRQKLRQYGSRASTGRKRHAKAPFNATETAEENNRQAFDQLPTASPAVTAAQRRRARGKAPDNEIDNEAAGPSSTAKGNTNGVIARTPFMKAPRKVHDPAKGQETTGPFSEFELRNIDRALKQWQEDHDLTDHARNELIHQNPQQAAAKQAYVGEMWDAIQAVVPQRKRQKIISQCRRRYHNFDARGAWTTEQHEELVELYQKHGPKYRKIADIINRFSEDVRDRVRNYVVCGDALKSQAWDLAEENKLRDIIQSSLEQIRAVRGDPDSEENRGKKEEDLIDWQGVSEGMNRSRSRLQCMNKWKKLKAAMDSEDNGDMNHDESMAQTINNAREEAMHISGHDLARIAKRVKDTGATSDGRIPWAKVHAQGVGTKYSRPTLMVAWCRLRTLVPEWEQATPVDIASTLRAKYREDGDLELPTDIDLDDEYGELEHKISVMLSKNQDKKTPKKNASKKSVNHQERRKSAYLAINSDDYEEPGDDDASDVDMGVGPSSAKIPADREIEESDLDEAPVSTKAKGKGKAKQKVKQVRRRSEKAPKGKGKGKALSQSMVVDEQSSDTDAEDAEDIPARIH
ncbi:hypothetical protein PG996_002596 [Apiospora saccharicola]|uniref:Myb-like domain-containing protein n=1 Tax=Apiospora saccharicola TaxID=335842 RepID=A0ABR1WJW7_9PEZI